MTFIELEETNILTRGLRGDGGYTGRSSGDGDGGREPIEYVLPLIVIFLVIVGWWYFRRQLKKFNAHAVIAKEEVLTHANEISRSAGMHTPTDGVYEIKFKESYILDGISTLTFTDNGRGYELSGTMKHSNSEIIDSIIAYDGKAYWKYVDSNGEFNRLVFVKGDFDFENNTFSGTWTDYNMASGHFTHFQFVHPSDPSAQQGNNNQEEVLAEAEEAVVVVPAVVVPDVVKPSTPPAPDQANSNATGGGGGASLFDQISSTMKK